MNQNPEQLARDRIDAQLTACGWLIQNKNGINLHAASEVIQRKVGYLNFIRFLTILPDSNPKSFQ